MSKTVGSKDKFHTHNQVLAVLEKMLPYMIIKRERSLAAIQLIKQKIK